MATRDFRVTRSTGMKCGLLLSQATFRQKPTTQNGPMAARRVKPTLVSPIDKPATGSGFTKNLSPGQKTKHGDAHQCQCKDFQVNRRACRVGRCRRTTASIQRRGDTTQIPRCLASQDWEKGTSEKKTEGHRPIFPQKSSGAVGEKKASEKNAHICSYCFSLFICLFKSLETGKACAPCGSPRCELRSRTWLKGSAADSSVIHKLTLAAGIVYSWTLVYAN